MFGLGFSISNETNVSQKSDCRVTIMGIESIRVSECSSLWWWQVHGKYDGRIFAGIGVMVDGYSKSLLNGRSTPTQDKKPDRSFMILPSDKQKLSPKQYFKAVTNASKGGGKQSRAKIANLPTRGKKLAKRVIIPQALRRESLRQPMKAW